ncbi:type IV toxin-antitoxin system AbiEi family antitoxin domain-containing protein [Alcaligenaceae bacterium]|nr:type IV toxin-antitoxin system AbiEi family antitoxin domain-containing protein [Burkholderiaceae bacterium]NYT57931.1 type IV toxin-antitoxin system AbiEi family antitoxin domain-containing protein [Alcaligenaceae bacterium]
MQTLSQKILEHATGLPEGAPLVAKELLHLGNRAAVDQALSRLVQRGRLLRAGRGIYVLPIENRFGTRAPSTAKMVENLAKQRGEVIVPHGASSANALGLTAQVPMQAIYLTSGPSRRLTLGAQKVELRHAPEWQLIYPGRAAGDMVRALAWLGPERSGKAIRTLRAKLSPAEMEKVTSARARLPTWMAQEISALVSHG